MTVSEASVKAVYEYVNSFGEVKFTCDEVAAGMKRSRENVRETLSTLAKRGLIEKLQKPQRKFCGNSLLYRRTNLLYVAPDEKADRYDFRELYAAWKIRAVQTWTGISRTHECLDEPRGFGEFADGTCL